MASSLSAGQNSDLLSALGEIAVVTEKDFVVSQSEGRHNAIHRSPSGIGDFGPVVQDFFVRGEFAGFAGAIDRFGASFRQEPRF